nr:hypothetical protein [Tanacetum cinerariifolium]
SKSKDKVVVSLDSKGSSSDDFSELKRITALLVKAFNRRKFYSKPTNNNLRTSSTSQSANKKQEFVKTDNKKVKKKDDEKKQYMSKVKCYNFACKEDKDEQVLLAEDQVWIESSSDSDQEINANMVFMAQIKKVLSDSEAISSSADEKISEVSYYISKSETESEYETLEYYDNTTTYGLFVNDNDDQEIFHECENFPANIIESQINHNESIVDHNDNEGVDKLIRKFNHNIVKCQKRIGFENPSYFENAKDLRPTLYDEKVIGLGYTSMFLTRFDEALEIKKFKRSRENKIEFAYNYGNLNASYVNEKLKFSDDYFQEIINSDFEKIDSLFQQTSSLKLYVSFVILEKIIIDLEDEVKKGSSNTSNVDLSYVSYSKLNKDVKRYSRKDLLSCNNSHLGETSSAYVYNDAMNVSCNSWLCDLFDENSLFIFNDERVRISPVSKMPFRKKPRGSMNVHYKSNLNKSLPRTVHRWLPKLQPLSRFVFGASIRDVQSI